MPNTPEILAIGEALIEFTRIQDQTNPSATSSLDTTSESSPPVYIQGFGGDTSNTIIAAARQGSSTAYISAVGDDTFGEALIDLWKREKVSVDYIKVNPGDPTGVYFVQPHASGRNFSYARRGSAASLYSSKELPQQAIRDAKALHASALSTAISTGMREAVADAFQVAKNSDTLVSFDTNLRLNLWDLATAVSTIEALLPDVDIVFPSDDEARQISGRTDDNDLVDYFLEFGCKMVALTRGAKGAIIATADDRFEVAPARVDAIDSTAAGDSFAGAFLSHYLETGDTLHAAECASVTAAITVSALGAIDAIPDRETVSRQLQSYRSKEGIDNGKKSRS